MAVAPGRELIGFSGAQYTPGDEGYDQARKVYNGLIEKRPGLIAQCLNTADIVAAVNYGREQGLEISVKGGGHSVAGKALTDGGLMIDLSTMKGTDVDPAAKTARVEPGVIWLELNAATQEHGLAVTGGLVSTTGVAGLTLGGGLGWLIPKYGLALDNLRSAEVVTAAGSVLTASESENADLFWGLRGGGGNLGVVSSFEFELHEVGPIVTAGLIAWPFSAGTDLLRFFRDYTASLPEELMAIAALTHAPDGSGHPIAALAVCHIGAPEQAERDLAPILSFGEPLVNMIQEMPYTAANALIDDAYPYGSLNYWKSGFLPELTDGAIDALVEGFARCPSAMPGIAVEHFHGAVTRVPVDATACILRSPGYNLALTTVWVDPEETEANIAWTRETYGALKPHCATLRYANYLGDDDAGDEVLRAAYGSNLERLAQVKKAYDPENLFRLNLNVMPA